MAWEELKGKLAKLGPGISEEYPYLTVAQTRQLLAEHTSMQVALSELWAYCSTVKARKEAPDLEWIRSLIRSPSMQEREEPALPANVPMACVKCGKLSEVNREGWCFTCFSAVPQ